MPLVLRDELLNVEKSVSRTTRAVIEINIESLEKQQQIYDDLDSQIKQLRSKYKYWLGLFASPEKQQGILSSIERRANSIKQQIEQLGFKPAPQLRELVQTDGIENVKDDLQLLVIWLDAQLNKKEYLSDDQRESLCEMIIGEYKSLRFEDIAICFKQGIKGKYGKVYNGLDVQIIMEWIAKYKKELDAIRMEQAERLHISTRGNQHDHKNKPFI